MGRILQVDFSMFLQQQLDYSFMITPYSIQQRRPFQAVLYVDLSIVRELKLRARALQHTIAPSGYRRPLCRPRRSLVAVT
jgi:hypothetical protein